MMSSRNNVCVWLFLAVEWKNVVDLCETLLHVLIRILFWDQLISLVIFSVCYFVATLQIAVELAHIINMNHHGGEIVVHTGNILNFEHLKKRVNLGPQEELLDCLKDALSKSATQIQRSADQEILQCGDQNVNLFQDENRDDMKITVKAFLMDSSHNSIQGAIQETLRHLQISRVDLLLVSLPSNNFSDFEPVWRSMEAAVKDGSAESIGVSDFSFEELQRLYDAAEVKPSVNQVNLESCCVIPPELSEYAKKNNIQLLTHNDPRPIMAPDSVSDAIKSSVASLDPHQWKAAWLCRYVAMVKLRGVVKSRGFIFSIRKS